MHEFSIRNNMLNHTGSVGQGLIPPRPGIGPMHWLGSNLPWFSQSQRIGSEPAIPFPIPDFIKQAAQQQLAAQQVAKLKFHAEQYPRFAGVVPNLPLDESVSTPVTVKHEHKIKRTSDHEHEMSNGKKRRGNYASYTPQQRVEIGAFSIECGTGRASKQFGLPESTARGFRDKLIKALQDGTETLPIDEKRMKSLKVLLENGHGSNSTNENILAISSLPWQAAHPEYSKTEALVKPMFQPQLDYINPLKIATNEEDANTGKSLLINSEVKKVDDDNSDEDSGNSSANLSGNEDAKKQSQFELNQLETLPQNIMQHIKPFYQIPDVKKSRKRSGGSYVGPGKKQRKTDVATSSPQELKNQALRAALYEQADTNEIIAAADEKIDNLPTIGGHNMDALVRFKGCAEITSPPSDISSIDGNEENQRNCHTPNSMSSNDNKEQTIEQSIEKSISQSDMSHAEASDLLQQVEFALDKVTHVLKPGQASFTGRLIQSLTRTVKYIADCENRVLEESALRMKLSSKVEDQECLINALSNELMKYEQSHVQMQHQIDSLSKRMGEKQSDSVLTDMTKLVDALRQPGQFDALKLTPEAPTRPVIELELNEEGQASLSNMIDALGDKMSLPK